MSRLLFGIAMLLTLLWLSLSLLRPAQAANPSELLVFAVDRPVTTVDRGFPRDDPPRAEANGNWIEPVNFAEGTLHFGVRVRSQPQPQAMRLQFCIWQDSFKLENCGPLADVNGTAGTVVTWSRPVQEIWRKNDKIIDWARPRQRYGFAIKNAQNQPVSDFNGWNWNGEDPIAWYPLDVQLVVVVVAKGESFSGWHNYLDGVPMATATPLTNPSPTPVPPATATPTAVSTPTLQPSATATVLPTITPPATVSATATATTTATAPSGPADPYEPNDRCEQAGAITTDGTVQSHTLHQPTDTDWIRFDATANTNYRIRMSTTADLLADVMQRCDDSDTRLAATVIAQGADTRINFRATTTGPLFLHLRPESAASAATVQYTVAVRQLETTVPTKQELFLPLVLQ